MADLYSVIEGLQPDAQEILEAELMCKQILEAKFPDLDLREGTALRDLVLRPNATLFALCKKGIDFYFTQNTIAGVDDVTPGDVVDGILSNWFLTRNIGIKSIINARMYFARRKNIGIPTSVYFSTDNTLKFYPVDAISFSASTLGYDPSSDEYYVDIDLLAETEGVQYNISSGSLLYFSNFDPYFLRAEINYLKETSINSETNLEFINRAKTAISTRNLINVPSIDFNLRDTFNFVKRTFTVGMGDPDMLRDQIKVVVDKAAPRLPENFINVNTTTTVTLSNHGYITGQLVEFVGSSISGYNGEFPVTFIDTNNFSYTTAPSLGVPVTYPTVQASNYPFLIHNGGKVDIYCSEQQASSIVQLTTDDTGKTTLTGPIYKFDRSSITGGSDDDTLPLVLSKSGVSLSITGNTVVGTITGDNLFKVDDVVTISGAKQSQSVTSLTGVGVVATATVSNHGYSVGNSVVISGATPSAYNGTFVITGASTNNFTYNTSVILIASATGTVTAEVNLLNSDHFITGVGSSSFNFNISQSSTAAVTGSITATVPVRYTITNSNANVSVVSKLESSGKTVTVTLPNHGYSVGRKVIISESSVSGYNGSWIINSILSVNQFTYVIPTSITGVSYAGNSNFVIPWEDYGFSEKQNLILDFGSDYANRTASFTIEYFQNLDSIQAYLDSSANRVLCADYLARGFNFYELSVNLLSYGSIVPSSNLVGSVITSYISGLSVGAPFIMTDMVSQLRMNGITNIQNPPSVTYKRYTRDLGTVESGTITDVLNPEDDTNIFILNSVSTSAMNIPQNNSTVSF